MSSEINMTNDEIIPEGFDLRKIEVVREFVDFYLLKNRNDLEAWKRKELWWNNTEYPKEFKKRIKALEKVAEIVSELEDLKVHVEEIGKMPAVDDLTGNPHCRTDG